MRCGDGGVVLPIVSSVCFEGNRRGIKVGSFLSAVSVWLTEGGVDARGEAAGLEGGVGGGRLSASYRWPMDKGRWLRETYKFFGLV